MDSKTEYSSSATAMKKIAKLDSNLAKELDKGIERANKFKQNWKSVNINEVVKKFAPKSTPHQVNGKIVFENADHTIAVVADAAGGYLRIQDLTSHAKRGLYLTLDGKNGHNVTINGKTRGRSNVEYELATHFRIKKKEEL
ncbi:MAG: hypothetical protein IJL67_02620 [Oscillospiraceae bacterium]|nr:hypothetical protein [Oscillospiraceae bacterium]